MIPATPDSADIRAGYQFVGQMISYEGQLVWRQARVFVLILAALVVGGFLEQFPGVTSKNVTVGLQTISALLAFVSALVWWSMALRSRGYYAYWIAQGRELEKHMPDVDILTKGRKFGAGNEVAVGGDHLKLRAFATFSHKHQVNYAYLLITTICALVLLSRLWILVRLQW